MSLPDEGLRDLERKALEGGPEDMVAYVNAAMRVVDIAIESASALREARAAAESTVKELKSAQADLMVGVSTLRERIESVRELAENKADAVGRPIIHEWDFAPADVPKEHMSANWEHEDSGAVSRRFVFRRPSPPLNVDHCSLDSDGWPKGDAVEAPAPRIQYCPENELQWRALVLSQLDDLSASVRKLAKVLHGARLIDAGWTDAFHL